jgi:hypothetical protein
MVRKIEIIEYLFAIHSKILILVAFLLFIKYLKKSKISFNKSTKKNQLLCNIDQIVNAEREFFMLHKYKKSNFCKFFKLNTIVFNLVFHLGIFFSVRCSCQHM